MQFRAFSIMLALSLTVLAGCADENGPATDADDEIFQEFGDATVSSDKGIIRGIVVDPTITPIEGVTVTLQSSGAEAVTNAEGAFQFLDLDPGAYFLQVAKVGWDSVQSSATVEAGVEKPDIIRIQINPNPEALPSFATMKFAGHLRCAGAALVVSFPCSIIRGTEDALGDYNGFVRNFDAGLPDFFQAELEWSNTQPAGEALLLDLRHCCDNDSFGANGEQEGPSPLIAFVNKTEMQGAAVLEDGMEISVFGAGYPGTEAVTGRGIGLQIEQPFTIYYTETFNFTPQEGWSFVAGDEMVVPE